MAFHEIYRRQVALLLRIIPLAAEEECFALKGGTAINLFLRNMPRLSVDVDLTYLPVGPRHESLTAISTAMARIADRVSKALKGAHVTKVEMPPDMAIVRLIVRQSNVQIKIEVTPVLRGCVFPPELRRVSPAVEDAYGFAEMRASHLPTFMAANLLPRSIANIPATSSTCATYC